MLTRTADLPSPMPALRAPRVAILEKHGGVLSWHLDLAAGFRELGADAITVQLRPTSLGEYRQKWQNGVTAFHNPALVERVAETLGAYQPDLVLVLKQAALPEAAITRWRRACPPGTPFVGWLCDHITSFPAGHVPCLDGVYHFDSATLPVLEKHYAGGSCRIAHLPLAVDPARFTFSAHPFIRRLPRLVFAGKNTPARRDLINEYRSAGGLADTFGPLADSGWRFWRRRHLDATRKANLYTTYFASLNLLQAPNTLHGLNLRAFEIPAAGGLATYPIVPDLAAAFVPDEEVIAYRNMSDLKRQIDALLTDPTRAEQIAAAGRARVLRDHTFAHRARRILQDWAHRPQPASP